MLIKIPTAKIEAIFRLEYVVADFLSMGFLYNSIIPKISGIKEITVSIRKSIIGG